MRWNYMNTYLNQSRRSWHRRKRLSTFYIQYCCFGGSKCNSLEFFLHGKILVWAMRVPLLYLSPLRLLGLRVGWELKKYNLKFSINLAGKDYFKIQYDSLNYAIINYELHDKSYELALKCFSTNKTVSHQLDNNCMWLFLYIIFVFNSLQIHQHYSAHLTYCRSNWRWVHSP